MYYPDKKAFLAKSRQGNLVPVYRELLADQETPLSAYERLRQAFGSEEPRLYSFLFESVEGGEHIARYSFLGVNPREVFTARDRTARITFADGRVEVFDDVDPLNTLRDHMARYRPVADDELPRFFGGAVGYLGYDSVAQFEKTGLPGNEPSTWEDMVFCITDTMIIFDRVRHTLKVVANAFIDGDAGEAYEDACARIDAMCDALRTPVPQFLVEAESEPEEIEASSNFEKAAFMEAVEKGKEYIRAGDVIQVVLSQNFSAPCEGSALDVYRALRSINPSPYMFCLELGGRKMVGSSPEIHVRCEDGIVEVRPIAGTRPRAQDPAKDKALEEELLADPKERAEHIMLVDLGRNDIGRVCRYNTVKVPELMVIERYSHVMHIVSDVVGEMEESHDAYDLMKATFPAGTVSGAPKVRAMQIISELEPSRRGPYAGAVGYFGFDGNLDSCIAIRTVLLEGGVASVQAGAGVVADSNPLMEYEETRNKARGMLKALGLAGTFARQRAAAEGGGAS